MTGLMQREFRRGPVSAPAAGKISPGGGWMVTLADLSALMVAFFALVFSMGEVDTTRWHVAETAIDVALDVQADGSTSRDLTWRNIDTISTEKGQDLNYLAGVVSQQIDELPALAGARIAVDGNRLTISLPQALLFRTGFATLEPQGEEALFALSVALSALANDIEIVGHTDPQPITGTRWPSNWELSLTRAAVVGLALRRSGFSRAVRISGAGSGRFDEINPRLPLAVRYPLARRVDIVVRSSKAGTE